MKKRRIIHVLSALIIAGMLLSCSESNIGTSSTRDSLAAENIEGAAVQKTHGDSPQQVFAEFQEMRKKVETMSKAEIENLTDEEILELGEPILKATENTVKLSEGALQKLHTPLGELFSESKTITKEEHNALSEEIDQIIASDANRETRNFGANDVRDLLLKFDGEQTMLLSTCETMFTVQGQNVILMQGDNFNLANYYCPAGYQFTITSGTHTGQHVQPVKNGNDWVGSASAIMDGQNNTTTAFTDLQNNNISGFEIRNYTEHGIYSTSSSTEDINIYYMTFKNIAPNASGQRPGENNSAVRFDNAETIYIINSYFEDVASSIRIRFSEGPIQVTDNEALNSGRNFFQCNTCIGSGIRINGNSMERTSDYGNTELEDWINILESEGLNNDWIQVNNNRARGHSNSAYGSFIIVADAGGKYQEAIGNIGVNPGQAGIGVPSGEYMYVADNKMYSEDWANSNVAFYSDPVSTPCNNHEFPASPANRANWKCGSSAPCPSGSNNYAWAPPSGPNCGIDFYQIRANVIKDLSLDEDIWNDW